MTLVRRIRRIAGSPRIAIRLRPAVAYGSDRPVVTSGSSHIRFVTPDVTLRLTTDASLTAIREERPFFLDDTVTLLLGPDETVQSAVAEVGRRFIEDTDAYWRDWVRRLAIPFEWQDAVIRAAITLQHERLRRYRRHRRRDDDVDPRGRELHAQLGLSLLLAARRLLRRRRAEPPRRDRHDGALPQLFRQHRGRRRRRAAAARLPHQRRRRARRIDRRRASRLSRHGPRAHRQ